ncbi:hypothetical protein [Actinomadura algeriensis]|uniref:Uncharacterized protein n=1 Tax=Actinomadura algeriensis TaxID=1679523 RepID=A0ABR9JUJ4_9ACTN|nr:hypothetical protein [Actinomadura algeriensis]MBE1534234.1 hypothetical protein [Actinomadura algeriensis]
MGATLTTMVTCGMVVLVTTCVGTVAMAAVLDRRRPRYQGRHRRAF